MEIIKFLPYLQGFIQVVDLGSFANAAKKLGLTTPTISKQVSKLEEILGFQLLLRTTRKLFLTEMGEKFYEQSKRIYEEVKETESVLSGMRKEPSGRLKVVSARYFAKKFIIPKIGSFLRKYPHIHLDLELAERMPDLEKEKVDILMGMSMTPEENVIQMRVMSTSYVFTASKKYLKEWGEPNKPKDLVNHRYLSHSMRRPSGSLLFPNGESFVLSPYLAVNDAETMLDLAIKGLGIMKTHRYVVQQAIQEGNLVEILKNFSEKEIPIYIAYSQRRMVSPKIRCFIDFVVDHLPRDKEW